MVRDARSYHHDPHCRGRPRHKARRSLPATQVGLPDLRIKKPISGRPEIGAQFQLWIFSYHIFAHLPKESLSRVLLVRGRSA